MSLIHDVALIFSPGWSHAVAREIALHFPDRASLFTLSAEELRIHLPRHTLWINRFLYWRKTAPLEAYYQEVTKRNITCIGRDDARYPPLLKEIHDPPLILFGEGVIPNCSVWCAIIGSRNATAYGTTQAFRFGKELAEHGVGIVSGLARGVDEYALRGACSVRGNVLAILAGGHLHTDERERALRELIIANNGAILSEQIPNMHPEKFHFPIRNRIIAGIPSRTLIIEGTLKSGSLITARSAIRENRDVFALPGPITSPTSEGCNLLIKEGAGSCTSIYDILGLAPPPQAEEGFSNRTGVPSTHLEDAAPQRHNSFPTPLHEKLWKFLKEPHTFDSLVEYAEEKGPEVAGIVNIWEIEGYLTIKNGYYSLVSL